MSAITRRKFIQIGAATAGVAAVGSGLTTNWWGLDRNPVKDPGTDGDKVVASFCELCFWNCGVLAHVKDGRVTKITGNPDHPLSKGMLCPRGAGATGLLYDPDRLKRPLIRTSRRGDDVFEEVSWDAALNKVGEGLLQVKAKHGPEAVALFTHGFGGSWFKWFMKVWGSPNIGAPSYAQCRGPREAAYTLTYGSALGSPEPIDIENARVITLIGSHLGENMHNTQVQEMASALGKGAELVVVDPRFSVAAGKARYWLPIKPGTDIALLLAWMNVILEEGRYDAAYLEKHATGLEELKAHVAGKTPEWAWPLTGVEPGLIRDSARFIASARPASLIHPGRHTTWTGEDTQRGRAMAILAALLGSWGRRGGYLATGKVSVAPYPLKPGSPKVRPVADRPKQGGYPVADEVLASGLCDATKPGFAAYDMKAWIVYGTNLIQSLPAPQETVKAIQNLDFLVAIDVLPAEILRLGRRGPARGHLPGTGRRPRHAFLQDPLRRHPPGRGRAHVRLEAGLVDRQGNGDPHRPRRVLPLDRRARVRGRADPRLRARRHRAPSQGRPAREAHRHLRGGGCGAAHRHREREDPAPQRGAREAGLRSDPEPSTRPTRGRRATSGCSWGAPPPTPSAAPPTTGCSPSPTRRTRSGSTPTRRGPCPPR